MDARLELILKLLYPLLSNRLRYSPGAVLLVHPENPYDAALGFAFNTYAMRPDDMLSVCSNSNSLGTGTYTSALYKSY